MNNLSDEQWLVLDLFMRARQKGVQQINRKELLHTSALPQAASLKLVWAMLTMPDQLVKQQTHDDFSITEKGIAAYELRFGKKAAAAPTTSVVDSVICLPGPVSIVN